MQRNGKRFQSLMHSLLIALLPMKTNRFPSNSFSVHSKWYCVLYIHSYTYIYTYIQPYQSVHILSGYPLRSYAPSHLGSANFSLASTRQKQSKQQQKASQGYYNHSNKRHRKRPLGCSTYVRNARHDSPHSGYPKDKTKENDKNQTKILELLSSISERCDCSSGKMRDICVCPYKGAFLPV